MTRFKQAGQSMTEYLVVLGVTGMALIAAADDVTHIFDSVSKNYSTQSQEMNKVQVYDSPLSAFSPPPSTEPGVPEEGNDEDSSLPPPLPTPDVPVLPSLERVYDSSGKYLGQIKNDQLVGDDGVVIATCRRNLDGTCKFVTADGKPIFPDSTTDVEYVDDDGKALPVVAYMNRTGQVAGFAYSYNGKLYSTQSGLTEVTDYARSVKAHKVMRLDENGVPHSTYYSVKNELYNITHTAGDKSQIVELVEVVNPPTTTQWSNVKPYLVMDKNWSQSLLEGAVLTGKDVVFLNSPQIFLNDGLPDGAAVSKVVYDVTSNTWTLLEKQKLR